MPVLPGGASRSLVLRTDQRLRLEALGDGANASVLLFAAGRLTERLCVPDTLKAQMQACVRPPMVLMSDAGRALCSVVGSSLDWHDALSGHSLPRHVMASSYATDGNGWKQSARVLLLDELAVHGLGERDLHGCVNLFSKVAPAGDERGTLTWVEGHSSDGDWVELRADQDVLIVLATSPHPLDPDPSWAGVALTVSDGPPPDGADPSALFRDESARALQAVR
jgi:uncharacterized protein YcgI (DUF1989 family)